MRGHHVGRGCYQPGAASVVVELGLGMRAEPEQAVVHPTGHIHRRVDVGLNPGDGGLELPRRSVHLLFGGVVGRGAAEALVLLDNHEAVFSGGQRQRARGPRAGRCGWNIGQPLFAMFSEKNLNGRGNEQQEEDDSN